MSKELKDIKDICFTYKIWSCVLILASPAKNRKSSWMRSERKYMKWKTKGEEINQRQKVTGDENVISNNLLTVRIRSCSGKLS